MVPPVAWPARVIHCASSATALSSRNRCLTFATCCHVRTEHKTNTRNIVCVWTYVDQYPYNGELLHT